MASRWVETPPWLLWQRAARVMVGVKLRIRQREDHVLAVPHAELDSTPSVSIASAVVLRGHRNG
jgi:hypothetical protein